MHKLWLPGSMLAVSLVAVSLGTTMPQTTLANSNASAVLNNPMHAQVTFVGTPVAPQLPPSNAITLAPGQSVPPNAPIGQPYVLPTVLPTGWQQMLVLRVNPGQGVVIHGYSGPVIAEQTDPSVITLEPNPNYVPSTAAVSDPATSATFVVESLRTNGTLVSGGALDFNGTFVMDNHVLNSYPLGGGFYLSKQVKIVHHSSALVVDQTNPSEDWDANYGLASLPQNPAPTGSPYQIDLVTFPTLGQQDTAVSYNNNSISLTTVPSTLEANRVKPPEDPYPDPWTDVYNQYSPKLSGGWSGNGYWDAQNHLVAIATYGYDSSEYGYDAGDIENYCNQLGIPYTTSTGS